MENIESEYREKNAWGMVASVDAYDCDQNFIKDPQKIHEFVVQLCDKIGMKRHGEPLIERFAEGALEGYSAMQFIETSSVTMHFDESENRAFVDIFSCKYFDAKMAEDFCKEFLRASRSKVQYYLRY